jgi:hypothetical protein
MVEALDSVDGVGLARPLCQEPLLCRDILAGKVKAAIEQKIDHNDFGATNVAAGTQIRQLGKDQEPIDLSKQENVDAFHKDVQTWMENMGKDTEGKSYGYVDLSGEAVPYGIAAAS